MNEFSINDLLKTLTTGLVVSGKEGTALAYISAVRKVQQVLGTDSLSVLFSLEGMHLCEKRLYNSGLSNNTVSFYMRTLRAIYNKGVDLGMCIYHPQLFKDVYTGVDNTPKRAVSSQIFGQLQQLDLSGKKNLAFARDLFLLSFSLQGISFVDLAYLRKSNLRGNLLTYHRAKTGSPITVALSALAGSIIEQYLPQTEGSPYLLPIIKNPNENIHLQHRSVLRTYNRRLKKLAALTGITENLTSYVARHTWATAARREDVPIGLISQALGHKTEKTTQIYLADFDYSALLEANENILMAANLVSAYKTGGKDALDIDKKNVSRFGSERHFRVQT